MLEIVRLCPEICFDVVGRTEEHAQMEIEQLAREANVYLNTEYVSDKAMKDAFTNCSWVIVPYNSASQSGIIIDAYKYARPVIAFAVGAIPEQVDDGKSGYLIEPGNNKMFADKLQKAIKMPSEQYDQMSRYAYEFGCKKYAASGAVERFEKIVK